MPLLFLIILLLLVLLSRSLVVVAQGTGGGGCASNADWFENEKIPFRLFSSFLSLSLFASLTYAHTRYPPPQTAHLAMVYVRMESVCVTQGIVDHSG